MSYHDKRVIVGETALDWLTLTTFNRHEFYDLEDLLVRYSTDKEEVPHAGARVMQYTGLSTPGWFAGVGKQRSEDHYMVRASGAVANDVGGRIAGMDYSKSLKCTRIDVQLTVDDYPVNLVSLAAMVEEGLYRWSSEGRKPRISYIHTPVDLDTVYVGSRKSQRFTRVYRKAVKGKGKFVRYEVEYKRDLAQVVWEKFVSCDSEGIEAALAGEIYSLSEDVMRDLYPFRSMLFGSQDDRPRVETPEEDIERTIRWLCTVALPCARRLAVERPNGRVARELRLVLRDVDQARRDHRR